MELSRSRADAEQVQVESVDLVTADPTVVVARLPTARFEAPAPSVVVDTDPRRLERILGNLLDNAREHAGGAGVEVELAVGRDDVLIAVSDRGPGCRPIAWRGSPRRGFSKVDVTPRREQRSRPGDRGRACSPSSGGFFGRRTATAAACGWSSCCRSLLPERYVPAMRWRCATPTLRLHRPSRGVHLMNRTLRRTCSILAVGALAIVTAACSASGSVGTVPPPPATATPAASIEPDITPDPSAGPTTSPRADPSRVPEPVGAGRDGGRSRLLRPERRRRRRGLRPDAHRMSPRAWASLGRRWESCSTGRPSGKGNGASVDGDPGRHAATRPVDQGRHRDRRPVWRREFRWAMAGRLRSAVSARRQFATLTQFANVHAVLFEIEGRTVTWFSSEGIVPDGPQARRLR